MFSLTKTSKGNKYIFVRETFIQFQARKDFRMISLLLQEISINFTQGGFVLIVPLQLPWKILFSASHNLLSKVFASGIPSPPHLNFLQPSVGQV